MATPVRLRVGEEELLGELNDGETAAALVKRLPLEVSMSRWGEEYYGDIGEPLGAVPAPDARDEMEIGELAFWIPGNALCIFFGPTPASSGTEPRAASNVNPVGKVTQGVAKLQPLAPSITLWVERA